MRTVERVQEKDNRPLEEAVMHAAVRVAALIEQSRREVERSRTLLKDKADERGPAVLLLRSNVAVSHGGWCEDVSS